MATSELAGQPAPAHLLMNTDQLLDDYHRRKPDVADTAQLVSFGTSGHRGSALSRTFLESHILAITQAICQYRRENGVDGPLFMGKDTHALSTVAHRTALEVLAANEVHTFVQDADGVTPTPAVSWAVITHNRSRSDHLADGIVITPSHNPPEDGGLKYNATHGGPADTAATTWIQDRANDLLRADLSGVRRVPYESALKATTTHMYDFVRGYVDDLDSIIDFDCIRSAGVRIGVDPLGGAALPYWEPIRDTYRIDLTVVNPVQDPRFAFMTLDHDGKIRMDCSSPFAMEGLIGWKDSYDVAFGNDPDADRHGIVTPSSGLLNPNHYLSVAIRHLFETRQQWPGKAAVGKTLVSSGVIDRVAASLNRRLFEVPVGFKWFVPALDSGDCAFCGEESAGASFLRKDGTVWTTDKDGIIMGLLAAEITARTGKDPGEHYRDIAARFGQTVYRRVDQPATPEEKKRLAALSPADVDASTLAGDPLIDRLTHAPGNHAAIGGLKCVSDFGWFAARPSGTEDIYKIYAESFRGESHLTQILDEAREIVARALA